MVMHPQEIAKTKEVERENRMWWELDKIAVQCSGHAPENTKDERLKKANAAINMMRYLHKPSHEWCQQKYKSENIS